MKFELPPFKLSCHRTEVVRSPGDFQNLTKNLPSCGSSLFVTEALPLHPNALAQCSSRFATLHDFRYSKNLIIVFVGGSFWIFCIICCVFVCVLSKRSIMCVSTYNPTFGIYSSGFITFIMLNIAIVALRHLSMRNTCLFALHFILKPVCHVYNLSVWLLFKYVYNFPNEWTNKQLYELYVSLLFSQ